MEKFYVYAQSPLKNAGKHFGERDLDHTLGVISRDYGTVSAIRNTELKFREEAAKDDIGVSPNAHTIYGIELTDQQAAALRMTQQFGLQPTAHHFNIGQALKGGAEISSEDTIINADYLHTQSTQLIQTGPIGSEHQELRAEADVREAHQSLLKNAKLQTSPNESIDFADPQVKQTLQSLYTGPENAVPGPYSYVQNAITHIRDNGNLIAAVNSEAFAETCKRNMETIASQHPEFGANEIACRAVSEAAKEFQAMASHQQEQTMFQQISAEADKALPGAKAADNIISNQVAQTAFQYMKVFGPESEMDKFAISAAVMHHKLMIANPGMEANATDIIGTIRHTADKMQEAYQEAGRQSEANDFGNIRDAADAELDALQQQAEQQESGNQGIDVNDIGEPGDR